LATWSGWPSPGTRGTREGTPPLKDGVTVVLGLRHVQHGGPDLYILDGYSVIQVPVVQHIVVGGLVEHGLHVQVVVGGLAESELVVCLRSLYLVSLLIPDH
jgi:hypothetical protein